MSRGQQEPSQETDPAATTAERGDEADGEEVAEEEEEVEDGGR